MQNNSVYLCISVHVNHVFVTVFVCVGISITKADVCLHQGDTGVCKHNHNQGTVQTQVKGQTPVVSAHVQTQSQAQSLLQA